METEIMKKHTNCRACGSKSLTKYLSLGKIPLCNNLNNTKEESLEAERFPLEIVLCGDCGLSQLSVVISPEKLYGYYTYRSSVNQGYIEHCRKMAKTLKERYDLNKDSLVIDIAGNDGTLLMEFYNEIGCDGINVDPAVNLTDISFKRGIRSMNAFWSMIVAEHISGFEKADVITATNVFAHVDNIKEFLEAAKIVLKPEGILLIECPYMGDHLEKREWTQTYFEHLSYMSVTPMLLLCERIGLYIRNIEHMDIHGGTLRYYISPKKDPSVPDNITHYLLREQRNSIKTYKKWTENIYNDIDNFGDQIEHLKGNGHKIAAFAASAKGNTLLNSAYINHEEIDYIVDETPEKIGKYSPGTGILIVTPTMLVEHPPDYLIILSWNFKDEIIEKCRKLGYKGKFIIPIPTFEIIE